MPGCRKYGRQNDTFVERKSWSHCDVILFRVAAAAAAACRSRASRWCLLFSLRLCEWSALVPPPPVRRLPALRYVLFLTWWCTSVSVTLGNQYLLLKNAREYIKGFSTISTVSFISSTIMTAIQPVVVLINSAVNFRRLSPHVAGLFMPPLRFNGWFVVACSTMAVGLVAKHVSRTLWQPCSLWP
ncbi:uncharacterized protein LOC127751692 [Frankliniella occidentalis]|uniref:Uncharacterized protein LOC127751692 n=1 Tax=Frankliniella occidentalis TaxID=133901 RepID=A0A9C6X9A7_FRAOC|nr:uncharacterized protein LOC127751692 [Frankliniella occidentalis]